MTTDKELLEAAARAAGIKIDKSPYNGGGSGNTGFDVMGNAVLDWHNGTKWNPLTDDGDALRLAVKLHLHINIEPYGAAARMQGMDWHGCESHLHGGLEAATRRAIVRAAAALSGVKE